MARLLVIGGGRMGEALIGGLVAAGWAAAEELAVVEVDPSRRDELSAAHPGLVVGDQEVPADAALVAVKPGDVAAAAALAGRAGAGRVLSVAAGVTTATLEAALPPGTAVVRAMPNTPALVGVGASAIAAGTAAGPDDLDWAAAVLGAVGQVVRVPEAQLDAVTGLSGSGPAYVFLLAEALIDAGVLNGLPRPASRALAVQTLRGAAALLAETGEEPATLRAQVTSPGGTTAAGLRALEAAGVRAAVLDAVSAAAERSRQLGG
ncbi:pyrroline-5-carboxylate reductase [Iamia majanohamensis]|uniref:Pyrroline-5-carboxylate reductase n=1 Tax=Iamia majanohamensis TaxID=467976 RepID=A0AAF0BV59_9ACTN|nr:pyrroline-5-carboxylate reductase [Iamia majanohamensis]WCO66758.1 pyrroline-5-carboxylate reductase [Iamia majanohamensis]